MLRNGINRRKLFAAGLGSIATSRAQQWVEVKRWTGNGQKNTESFRITGGQWRIRYSSRSVNPALTIFQIYVYGIDPKSLDIAANSTEPGDDVSYMHKKGQFYLQINTSNRWTVIVEQES